MLTGSLRTEMGIHNTETVHIIRERNREYTIRQIKVKERIKKERKKSVRNRHWRPRMMKDDLLKGRKYYFAKMPLKLKTLCMCGNLIYQLHRHQNIDCIGTK